MRRAIPSRAAGRVHTTASTDIAIGKAETRAQRTERAPIRSDIAAIEALEQELPHRPVQRKARRGLGEKLSRAAVNHLWPNP